MRVLIADDQKEVAIALAALVERCGHEVLQIVGSGLEAIQSYSRLLPDVVLMDFAMPRLNGASATRIILSSYPEAKVIMVTGFGPAERYAETGVTAVLLKPVELDKLYAALYDAAPRTISPDSADASE